MSTGPFALWINSVYYFVLLLLLVFISFSFVWIAVVCTLYAHLRAVNDEMKEDLMERRIKAPSSVIVWLYRILFLCAVWNFLGTITGMNVSNYLAFSPAETSSSLFETLWTIAICDVLVCFYGICFKKLSLKVCGNIVHPRSRGYFLELEEGLLSIYRQLLPVVPWLRLIQSLSFGGGGAEWCHQQLGLDFTAAGSSVRGGVAAAALTAASRAGAAAAAAAAGTGGTGGGTGGGGGATIDVRLVQGPVPYQEPPFAAMGGGEVSFLGRTREEVHSTHGKLLLLRYEAKESMAIKVLSELAADIADRHKLLLVRVVHSLGDVPVSQASVLVQVVGVHRKEAFDASAEMMDRLKKKVPIWKQEVWEDGATWKDGAVVDPNA